MRRILIALLVLCAGFASADFSPVGTWTCKLTLNQKMLHKMTGKARAQVLQDQKAFDKYQISLTVSKDGTYVAATEGPHGVTTTESGVWNLDKRGLTLTPLKSNGKLAPTKTLKSWIVDGPNKLRLKANELMTYVYTRK